MSTITTIQSTDQITDSRSVINDNFSALNTDKVEGPSSSVDSEVALFSGTGGKTIKRASGTGVGVFTSGVLSFVTAPSGTIVGTSDSQTLSNKTLGNTTTLTIKDANFTLQDNSDTTKQAVFELSGITTGNTRTYTLPDASTTLVGHDTTQTLSNKTLGNTTALTIKDSSFVIQDNGDTTKQLQFELSNITTGNVRTLTVPDASTTLVGTDTTQTLTNKTLTSPKIGTVISDTNGNELFNLTATASAVNELTFANAATGANPTFSASGGDTDVGIDLKVKGAGLIRLNPSGGHVRIGGGTSASEFRFYEPSGSGSNYIAFKAQAMASDLTYIWPAADGSSGQFLKTDGSGNLSWASASGSGGNDYSCRIKQTGTTSVSTSWAALAFAGEDFDTDTMHDNATNNSRITFTHAGKYCVGATMMVSANAVVGLRIKLNGSTVIASQKQGNGGSPEHVCIVTTYNFSAGDYVEIEAYCGSSQSSSGDANTNAWAFLTQ